MGVEGTSDHGENNIGAVLESDKKQVTVDLPTGRDMAKQLRDNVDVADTYSLSQYCVSSQYSWTRDETPEYIAPGTPPPIEKLLRSGPSSASLPASSSSRSYVQERRHLVPQPNFDVLDSATRMAIALDDHSDVISGPAIANRHAESLYQAIMTLRPHRNLSSPYPALSSSRKTRQNRDSLADCHRRASTVCTSIRSSEANRRDVEDAAHRVAAYHEGTSTQRPHLSSSGLVIMHCSSD